MKKFFLLTLFIFIQGIQAQIPNGYYDGTDGLTGSTLKTKLHDIIKNGHRDRGYNALWTAYETTDVDKYYDKDGSVLDIYSENPIGKDPYSYKFSDKCGNPSKEGDCYNREHIIPQSLFSERSPMKNDVHTVRATDGKVNGDRGSFPFGVVKAASKISKNGSKVGVSGSAGYNGTVFEPIDEFKGDIARMIFYFITRYENQLGSFNSGNTLSGNTFPGLLKWQLDVLMAWHNQDSVSQTETDRNNASYSFQGNRNPFIDHPEWVNAIWGTPSDDATPPTAPTNLVTGDITSSSVSLSWAPSTDNIGVTFYEIYVNSIKTATSSTPSAIISGLTPNTTYSFHIVAKDAAGNISGASNTVTATTLNGTPSPTTSCGTENFENIPTKASGYEERIWENNHITWTATNARTDETINGKAITIRNGKLSSSTISGGIGSLTITTQRKYNGSAGTLDLIIKGQKIGTIPYDTKEKTTTIENINAEGDITIEIRNSSSDRVALDDLSWTCYSTMGTNETIKPNKITLSPNPVKNNEIYIGNTREGEQVKIFNINGQLVQISKIGVKGLVKLNNLKKGIYIVSVQSQTEKIIVQ